MLDERGFKPLSMLKDDPGFAKLNWFSLFRLKTPLEKFSRWNDLTLRSTGVTLPSVKTNKKPLDHAPLTSTGVTFPFVKTGRTPLDYFPCISKVLKRITMGSSYFRQILLLHKPKDAVGR